MDRDISGEKGIRNFQEDDIAYGNQERGRVKVRWIFGRILILKRVKVVVVVKSVQGFIVLRRVREERVPLTVGRVKKMDFMVPDISLAVRFVLLVVLVVLRVLTTRKTEGVFEGGNVHWKIG